jgi:hypothetical protein
MGWFIGSIELVLPVEDAHIAFGHAEAVDVLRREGRIGFAGSTIPVGEALLPARSDGLGQRGFAAFLTADEPGWTQMKNTDKDSIFARFICVQPVHRRLNFLIQQSDKGVGILRAEWEGLAGSLTPICQQAD